MWLGQCARARTFLLIQKAITCLLEKSTREPPEDTIMSWFLVLLARNTGYSVRVNHKVSTTAAASNKQGDVALVNFGLVGSNHFAIDVSICCVDHIGNNGHLYGKMHTNVYVHALAGAKNRKYKENYVAVGTKFAPAIVSVAGQIHSEFLRLLWVLADK